MDVEQQIYSEDADEKLGITPPQEGRSHHKGLQLRKTSPQRRTPSVG